MVTRLAIFLMIVTVGMLRASSTNLLPGITFYDGPEKLTGKLVLLLKHEQKLKAFEIPTNGIGAATIYEYDIGKKTFQKTTDSPFGIPGTSYDGDIVYVVCQLGEWDPSYSFNHIFAWSKSLKVARIISTPKVSMAVATAGHVFYVAGETFRHRLFDYDIAADKTRLVKLPDDRQHESEDYTEPYIPRGLTNYLRFEYRALDRADVTNGGYCYDIGSGIIRPISDFHKTISATNTADYAWQVSHKTPEIKFSESLEEDANRYHLKTFDGSDIGFDSGESGLVHEDSLGPEGFKLMTASYDSEKVLHRFSRLKWAFSSDHSGYYRLWQLSPDRHHAVVVLGGATKYYYLVDVSTGETRLLLKAKCQDDSDLQMLWIPGE